MFWPSQNMGFLLDVQDFAIPFPFTQKALHTSRTLAIWSNTMYYSSLTSNTPQEALIYISGRQEHPTFSPKATKTQDPIHCHR